MTIRERLHDLADTIRNYPYRNAQDTFSRLNPTLNGLHPNALIDDRAAHALEDENGPWRSASGSPRPSGLRGRVANRPPWPASRVRRRSAKERNADHDQGRQHHPPNP